MLREKNEKKTSHKRQEKHGSLKRDGFKVQSVLLFSQKNTRKITEHEIARDWKEKPTTRHITPRT